MNKTCVFIGGKQIGADCLRILLDLGIKPNLVIANMDDKGKDLWHESLVKIARQNNLLVIKDKRVKDPSIVKEIKKIDPEIIYSIGGTQIIPPEVLKIPKIGVLNIHPALLPKYRGRFSTVHALFNNEQYSGVSSHFMDSGIDSGPIIFQKKIKISKNDTARSLYDKFTTEGAKMFTKIVKLWLEDKKIVATPQKNEQSTFYPKKLPNNGQINWKWNGDKILRFIRAMTFEPFPPVVFKIGEKEMVIADKKYFKGLVK